MIISVNRCCKKKKAGVTELKGSLDPDTWKLICAVVQEKGKMASKLNPWDGKNYKEESLRDQVGSDVTKICEF